MKISYKWLKDYLEFDLTPDQVADILTSTGLETESVTQYEAVRGGLRGIVIGQVISCSDHPDASKLKICKVDIGMPGLLTIVCGAPNVAEGQKVPVACSGSDIYPYGKEEGIKILTTRIRGVVSEGMICAEDELGLGNAHDGIMVLSPDAIVGSPLSEHLGIYTDTILEIGLTPNRTDAMSHMGVARDLAARIAAEGNIEVSLRMPETGEQPASDLRVNVAVEILNNDACKRYTGIVLSDVSVAPSPTWLKNRLLAIGIKPHNNVVDITNYVLHETGHPLHAFDHDLVEGGKIVIRNLTGGTPFITLDGVEHHLSDKDLMICDAEKPLCIAGVYGGIGSGVTEKTTRVFLESAWFDPVSVRRTSKRHGLNTDASFRFERGADPQITVFALERAVSLLCEIAGARVCSEMADEGEYSKKPPVKSIFLRFERIRLMIGKSIGVDELQLILRSLGFEIVDKQPDGLMLKAPSYRVEVTREIDIIEEVMRIYGMNNVEIPGSIPVSFPVEKGRPEAVLKERIASYLVDNGFYEVWNNSITSSSTCRFVAAENTPEDLMVKILNPLSQDLDAMRVSLLPGLLENARHNINRKTDSFSLFEFGTVYFRNIPAGFDASVNEQFTEKEVLGMVLSGKITAESWYRTQSETGFFDVKAYIDRILKLAGCKNVVYSEVSDGKSVLIQGVCFTCNGEEVARIGRVKDKLLRNFGLKQTIWYAEIYWLVLTRFNDQKSLLAEPLPRYPYVRRDLSIIIDNCTKFSEIEEVVMSASPDLLKDVILFDVYQADNMPQDKKSYAIGLIIGDQEKTLEENEIDRVVQNIVAQLNNKFGAVLR